MSLRVHCDQCDEYMYRTPQGTNTVHADGPQWVFEKLIFCSDMCKENFIRFWLLHEDTKAKEGSLG